MSHTDFLPNGNWLVWIQFKTLRVVRAFWKLIGFFWKEMHLGGSTQKPSCGTPTAVRFLSSEQLLKQADVQTLASTDKIVWELNFKTSALVVVWWSPMVQSHWTFLHLKSAGRFTTLFLSLVWRLRLCSIRHWKDCLLLEVLKEYSHLLSTRPRSLLP